VRPSSPPAPCLVRWQVRAVRVVRMVGGALALSALAALGLPESSAADVAPTRSMLEQAGSPTTLTLAADPAVVGRGRPVSLVGRLTDSATGAGVVGAPVQAETLGAEGAWVPVATLTTDGAGAVVVTQPLERATTYRLHHGTTGSLEESTSAPVTVTVATLTAQVSPPGVRVGRPVTVGGVLAAGGPHVLRLERRVAGSWQLLARVTTAADGSYRFRVTPTATGTWRLRVVRGPRAGTLTTVAPAPLDVYRVHTYVVRTRGAVRADLGEFRAMLAETYADPRGWLRGHHRFRPAAAGQAGDLTVVLAQARYLPTYSRICSPSYSCQIGRTVIINETRWRSGSPSFPGSIEDYRRMVVNHETGHWLGRPHA
jgi:hypothetical protein